MTLNITIATKRSIFQSADYQLTDTQTGQRSVHGGNQKIKFALRQNWHCSICFNGIGYTNQLHVSEWLAERIAAVGAEDPFERLIDELLTADKWIAAMPPSEDRRHTFTIGAFIDAVPEIAMISNYETINGTVSRGARSKLTVERLVIKNPTALVSGSGRHIITTTMRGGLCWAASVQSKDGVFSSLAQVNRAAASMHNSRVSHACFTVWLGRTSEAAGKVHGIDIGSEKLMIGAMAGWDETGLATLRAAVTKGRSIKQFVMAASGNTPAYWKAVLMDKPNDPHTHNNYGAHLADHVKDDTAARQAYQKALTLDPTFVLALSNLALLEVRSGNATEARRLWDRANHLDPGNEVSSYGYAEYLVRKQIELGLARSTLNEAIARNVSSARLHALLGDLEFVERRFDQAVTSYAAARDLGQDQKVIEPKHAIALHLAGAEIWQCIGAYRTAIAVDPDCVDVLINLSQLLFIVGNDNEAQMHLERGMSLNMSPSAELEGLIYSLAHVGVPLNRVEIRLKELYAAGARLDWDIRRNIELIKKRDPILAAWIEELSEGHWPVRTQ